MKRKIFDAHGTIEQADSDTAHLGPVGSVARFGNCRNDRSANRAAEPDLDAHLDHQHPQRATGDDPCYFSPPRIGLSLFHHFPNELIPRPKRRFCSAMQICVHHGQSDKNIRPNVLTHDPSAGRLDIVPSTARQITMGNTMQANRIRDEPPLDVSKPETQKTKEPIAKHITGSPHFYGTNTLYEHMIYPSNTPIRH